jgi:allophanate hydrolase
VKDCIDVAGVPTTSACPEFSYVPAESNLAVDRLLSAGAIFIGKTNMDQFATGLVGVRSPYGVARNPFDADYIPGGSSSGAAVSVAAGLVSFALGTDTGGSGRVPAAFNNVVGLKPTRGLISGIGNVPACRSIETLSIFALTVPDAQAAFDVVRYYDKRDPFSRAAPLAPRRAPATKFRFGVPGPKHLNCFGDTEAARLFMTAVRRLEDMGGTRVDIDYAPFLELNDLLFQGPWLAERYGALSRIVEERPASLLPVTREILLGGSRFTGADVFAAQQQLKLLKRQIDGLWSDIDVFAVPTTGTIYRVSEIEADPINLNARLGTYTNFVNLADLAAVAVPSGFLPNGLPQGVTLIGLAFADNYVADVADRFHRNSGTPLGARNVRHADKIQNATRPTEQVT